jgi:hypothetical protein
MEAGAFDRGSFLEALLLFYRWIRAGLCIIRANDGRLVSLYPNRAQRELFARILGQAVDEKPVRIIILKARKLGMSTFVQALFFFLCAHYPNRRAFTVGHEAKATDDIFEITKRIAANYPFVQVDPTRREIGFPEQGSRYSCQTAAGQAVGAGSTPSFIHLSEVSKWTGPAEATDYTASNAVPRLPGTIIVYESTATGRNLFWRKFEAAHDPENPFAPLFLPWFLDESLRSIVEDPIRFETTVTGEECDLRSAASGYGIFLTREALQWRRTAIKEIGAHLFRQEYPSTPEESVSARKGLILPRVQRAVTESIPVDPYECDSDTLVGGIDAGYFDATVFVHAVVYDGRLWIYDIYRRTEALIQDHVEALRPGCRYWIDPSAVQFRRELQRAAQLRGLPVRIAPAPRIVSETRRDSVRPELSKVRELIEQGRIRVLRSCAEPLLVEADSFFWNSRTDKPHEQRSESVGHYDVIAALRYLICGCWRRLTAQALLGNESECMVTAPRLVGRLGQSNIVRRAALKGW